MAQMAQTTHRGALRVVAPLTPIYLDRERHLRFDLEALAMIEDECGVDLINNVGGLKELNVRQIGTIVWAGLTHEDPELDCDDPQERKMAIRRIRRMIDLDNISQVMEAFEGAFSNAMPEATDDDPPLAQESPLDGSSSGPLDGKILPFQKTTSGDSHPGN